MRREAANAQRSMNLCHAFSWGLLRKEHARTHSLCLNTWVSFIPLKKSFLYLYCMEWPSGDGRSESKKGAAKNVCVCVCQVWHSLCVHICVCKCLHEFGPSFVKDALLHVKIEPISPKTSCQYGLKNFCFATREKVFPPCAITISKQP